MIGRGLIATPTAEGRKSPIAWPMAEDDNVGPKMGEADMADRLASWNDGETKAAIVDFVERVTTEGGPDFVPPAERIATFDKRPVTEEIYGIPPERVVGSSIGLRYLESEDGGTVTYAAEPDVFDDGPIKPVRIWSRVGRRPILAAGNSNGDVPMLRYAAVFAG